MMTRKGILHHWHKQWGVGSIGDLDANSAKLFLRKPKIERLLTSFLTTFRPLEYTKQGHMIFQNIHLGDSVPLRLIQPINKGGVGGKGTVAA